MNTISAGVSLAPAGGSLGPTHLERSNCLEWAERAYSIHGTRPWRLKLLQDSIEVWSDGRRHLRLSDPDRRELTVSVGAVIAVLDLALRSEGKLPKVVLMPDAGNPQHLATIRIAGSHGCRRRDLNHLSHLARRSPVIPYPDIPAYILCNLQDAVLEQRADVAFISEQAFLSFVSRPGCPAPNFGARVGFTMSFPRIRAELKPVEAPVYAAVCTPGDSVKDWLVAGRGLQRLLLAAADDGLCATVLADTVSGEARSGLNAQNPSWGHTQAVVRLDYGPRAQTLHSAKPRSELLI